MKAWTSRLAVTKGVREVEVIIDIYGIKAAKPYRPGTFWFERFGKNTIHNTKAEAIAAAERQRVTKIRALHLQIENLEKMKFT